MQTDTILDLLRQLEELDLSPDKRERMEKVVEQRASGGPYRTTPLEDYVRRLEFELVEERAKREFYMDRVVELEAERDRGLGYVLTHDITRAGVVILAGIGFALGMFIGLSL